MNKYPQFISFFRQLSPQWEAHLALLRLKAHWRSMSTAILGILLVSIVGASIPLYTSAIAQVGMIQHIHQQPAQDVNVYLQTSRNAVLGGDLDAAWTAQDADLNRLVQNFLNDDLPGWAEQLNATGETTPMHLLRDGEDLAARLRIAYYAGWESRLQLVEGSWPTVPSEVLEVAIGQQAAERLGLMAGDEIVLEQRGWVSSIPLRVRITAVVRAVDEANAPVDIQYGLRIGSSADGAVETNLLTTREGFLRAATQHVPEADSTFGWWLLFDHEALAFADVPQAITAVDDLHQSLPTNPRFIFRTQIATVLDDYVAEVDLLGAPFGLLLVQIGALALFFLIVTAALVRRAERREIAMLQSRGGANWQIALLDGFETLLISGVAMLAAPWLARQFLAWFVPFLTGIERLPLRLDGRVFAYAGAAAGVSLLVLTTTLVPILRLPLIIAGGAAARSEKRLWWQRYYLDMGLLIVGVAASWRLLSQGTPLIETQTGELKADPLLLLAPVFWAVAVGSMALRLFPTLSGWAARATARWGRLESALAMWQVSREPAHYGRLSFLLALAIGIGWLATSFHATLLRSQHDQAAYQVGADIRLQERDMQLRADRVRPLDFYRDLPGVEAVTQTSRFFLANASSDPQQRMPGEILAVDSETFRQVSYWRDDLGLRKTPPDYESASDPGRVLPFVPARIGVWLRIEQPARDEAFAPLVSETGEMIFELNLDQMALVDVGVRLRDANGSRVSLPLKPQTLPVGPEGWQYFEGDLATLPHELYGDVRLEMVHWHNDSYWGISRGGIFRLDLADLTLVDADQVVTTLNWLEADERWELVHNFNDGLEGLVDAGPAPDWAAHVAVRRVSWNQESSGADIGLALNYPDLGPVPVIASSRLATLNGLLTGTTFQAGMIVGANPWFQLVDTVEFYPTLNPDTKLFLVADQRSLLYVLNRRPGAIMHPSEVWLRLQPGHSPETVLDAIALRTDPNIVWSGRAVEQVRDDLDADLLQSGLIGLLYMAFAVALTLSVISLVSYIALTARQRRTDFGVLQAIGLSARGLVASIVLEQVMVMVVGLSLGALLGSVMSERVLPTLAFGTSGETITPPFEIQVEVRALLQYGAFLLVVLAVTFAASLILVRRLSLAELLRFGEE